MNILIINGSPRKKGLISQMLSIMQEEAETRGDTVEMVYTNDLTVKPCKGCMACRTKEKCVLAEDDSQRVLKMMHYHHGGTLLLGQHPWTDETDVRPSGVWHDA
jgi:multimeric flavodoxin WrbA